MKVKYEDSTLLKVITETKTEKGLVSLGMIENYYGDLLYVVDAEGDESSYREFEFCPGIPGEPEARKAYADAAAYYNSLVPQENAYSVKWIDYYTGSVFDKALAVFQETYESLMKLPKPEPYRIGGTYYGGTQLFSSVGNHLDMIEDKPYSSYDSYCKFSTNYSHMWGIKIGGAYKLDSYNYLRKFMNDNRQQLTDAGYAIIDDYGSNFSIYGIAIR
jgi:hypothetical protein